MHTFLARLASFCHLGFISDPLIVSKFQDETHDPKGQENKNYTTVNPFFILKELSTLLRETTYSGFFIFMHVLTDVNITFSGFRRFLTDIETMIGNKICGCMPFWLTKYWWALMWCVVTPAGVLVSYIIIPQ